MSKDLPYFKFYPGLWLTGDITLESLEIQGAFINVCAYYWAKECKIEVARLKQRYGQAIARLIEVGLITDNKGFASIGFLNEQYNELYARHQKNVENGRRGGSKASQAKAPLKHLDKIRKDKIRKDTRAFILERGLSFEKKFLEWLDYRKEKRKPLSIRAAEKQIDFLMANPGSAEEIIEQSIRNDWQGLFDLKAKPQNGTNGAKIVIYPKVGKDGKHLKD